MAPDDATPPDFHSDAVSGTPVPDTDYLSSLIAALTERVVALEQAIAYIDAPSVAAPVDTPSSIASGPAPPMTSGVTPPPLMAAEFSVSDSTAASLADKRSLEDRLGSQIFNRIGIIAILTGATWFLKLAMDNHWIGPLGRILIGLVAGAGIVVWSERFRRREFATFSYSLKAIGTGVLYLSLWASFQLYHLIPSQIAFALMLLVTLWNVWMAWSQQSEVIAAYAIAGAFSTPALLSTAGNHQIFLFSYLLTIDVAAIALIRLAAARSKSWSRLLLAALPTTIVYFIGWYSRFYSADQVVSTSVFITLFFAAFSTVPFRLRSGEPDATAHAEPISDVFLPLTNAVFASLALYAVLENSGNHASLPWVALLFAAVYLVAIRVPLLSQMQTAVARAVHLSLAVLFLTIAIPLKANGRWITIGWLAEGVALLWVSARLNRHDGETDASAQRMLSRLASLALLLGFLGILVTPIWLDRSIQTAIFNRRFATELAGIIGFAASTWISLRAATVNSHESNTFPDWLQLAGIFVVALNLIALQVGIVEIQTFWTQGQSGTFNSEVGLQTALSISAFLMLYGAGLLTAGFWKRSAFLRWQGLGLLVVATLKTFLYDVRSLSQGYRVASFLGLGALLMAVSFAYVRRDGKTSPNDRQ